MTTPDDIWQGVRDLADEPWKRALVQLAVTDLAATGHAGLEAVPGLVARLRAGSAVDLQSLGLREASDLLAAVQHQEAEHNKRVDVFVHTLTTALTEAVKLLVGAFFNKVAL